MKTVSKLWVNMISFCIQTNNIVYVIYFLQVVVANSKRDGSTRDPREDERLVRLFVIIPKHFTEQKLRSEFSVSVSLFCSLLKDHVATY